MSPTPARVLRKYLLILAPCLLLFPLTAFPVLAQEESGEGSPVHWGFTAGLGASTEAFAGVASADAAFGDHLFSLRGTVAADILGPSLWDVGLLYGRTVRWSRGAVGASAGVGLVGGDRSSGLSSREPIRVRPGIPLALRAAWYPTSFAGLGTYVFGNVNGERTFGGVALTVELGDLR